VAKGGVAKITQRRSRNRLGASLREFCNALEGEAEGLLLHERRGRLESLVIAFNLDTLVVVASVGTLWASGTPAPRVLWTTRW